MEEAAMAAAAGGQTEEDYINRKVRGCLESMLKMVEKDPLASNPLWADVYGWADRQLNPPTTAVDHDVAVQLGLQATRPLVRARRVTAPREVAIAAVIELLRKTGGRHAIVGSLASGLDVASSDVDFVLGTADVGRIRGSKRAFDYIGPVVTAVAGKEVHHRQVRAHSVMMKNQINDTFLAQGFDSIQYDPASPLLRMRHIPSNLSVSVWCDPLASHKDASVAEMRTAAAKGLVQGNELLRLMHRVLRRAGGLEMRVCESHSVALSVDGWYCGSYVLLLLVHRWLARVEHRLQCGATGPRYRHDGGEGTALALLALLDYLGTLLDFDGVIELAEPIEPPPPPSHPSVAPLPPSHPSVVPPIKLDLRKSGKATSKKAPLPGKTIHRSAPSLLSLTTLARLLADALRRGVPLDDLLRPLSAARTELIESVCEVLEAAGGRLRNLVGQIRSISGGGSHLQPGPLFAANAKAKAEKHQEQLLFMRSEAARLKQKQPHLSEKQALDEASKNWNAKLWRDKHYIEAIRNDTDQPLEVADCSRRGDYKLLPGETMYKSTLLPDYGPWFSMDFLLKFVEGNKYQKLLKEVRFGMRPNATNGFSPWYHEALAARSMPGPVGPTTHALAGLVGLGGTTASGGGLTPSTMEEDECEEDDDAAWDDDDVSEASYFTNRWLPSGIEGLTVGEEHGARPRPLGAGAGAVGGGVEGASSSDLGRLGLDRNAPVFTPRSLQGISE